jgi:uncharacterized protein (TIGR02099 family)
MLKLLLRYIVKKFRQMGHTLFVLSVALAIAAMAVFLAVRYWVLPDIEKYHHDITLLAGRAIGMPVTIGKIEADWRGLRPHLVFTDVRLLDERGNSVLVLRRVENVVSWMTLPSRELRLHALQVDEPDLAIRRDKQGLLHIAGLAVSGASGDDKLSDWLLHQSHIILRNGRVSWQDELYDRPLLVFSQAQFRLDNSGRHHRFAARISPPADVAAPLDVRGDLVGRSFSDLGDWRGELFAQIERADSGAWGAWVKLPEVFSHARGGVRAWLGIEAGQISRVTADLAVSEVQSRMAADLPLLNLASLNGRVGWHALERGFEVSTKNLSLLMGNGFKLQPTDFHLRLNGSKESPFAAGEIQANAIDLGDLAVMADYIPLGKTFKQQLADFSPRGHITDLRAQWHSDPQHIARFDIKARFDEMSMRRVGSIPGVTGLSGQISGSDSSGSLSLNAPHLQVDAPQLLLEPLAFDTLTAQADWQRKSGGWDVKLNNFSAANADLAGTAFGNYQTDEHGPGIADVTLNLSRASLSHAVRYLPKELLGQKTMTWLQSALQGGNADEVHLRLRGDLNDFPFPENKKGQFQVSVKARGVAIDYTQNWPRVEDANVTLLIEGPRLQVDSDSLMLAGARVQRASVAIPDITAQEPLVQVRGEAVGETKHCLDFIQHSPVRGYINGFTDEATVRGEGKLDVQLDIPLSDKPVKLNGNYHFSDNDISIYESIPTARKVTGDFAFTESTLRVNNIKAQILGGPATLIVHTEADGGLKAKLQGRANMAAWRKVNADPVLPLLKGEADWNAEISVRDKQFVVVVDSKLKGLGSDLPAPLSKKANEIVPLRFEMRSATSEQDVMWLQYGEVLNARMVREADDNGVRNFTRGYVNFGPARKMVDREGVWLSGVLSQLSLEGWRVFWQRNSGSSSAWPEIDGADVTVQNLTGYDAVAKGLNVHARNRNGIVSAQLSSKELSGELSWMPQGKGKLIARLKTLTLGYEDKDKKVESAHVAKPLHGADSLAIPVVDLAADNFVYRGNPLGRLEMHASPFEKDILLDHFRLVNPDGVLVVNGKWGTAPAQTHMIAKLTLSNVGNVLARSGYPNSIKNGSGSLDADLVWAGGPHEMALENLDGHLNLKMAKGQFLKLDPGAGKLLSVLSLQSLPKRITLDFTDVFSTGFEFDSIDGEGQIRQGVLLTNDFKIYGSAAKVSLSGQVDLSRETQSLRVRIMPTIGDSVSLLALAAVNPVVGAGVYIANKILSNPLDKLVSFDYNVTGSWADPKVEKASEVKNSPNH